MRWSWSKENSGPGKILMISQTLFVLVEIQSSDIKVWRENLQFGAHLPSRLELYIKVLKHWIYFSKENKYEISKMLKLVGTSMNKEIKVDQVVDKGHS